jgi:hypothetical protein
LSGGGSTPKRFSAAISRGCRPINFQFAIN